METKPEQDRQALAATEAQDVREQVLRSVRRYAERAMDLMGTEIDPRLVRLYVARELMKRVVFKFEQPTPPVFLSKSARLPHILAAFKAYFDMCEQHGQPQASYQFTPRTLRDRVVGLYGQEAYMGTHQVAELLREDLKLKKVRNGTFYYLEFDPELEKVWEMRGRGLYYEVSRDAVESLAAWLDM
jgi:hypothetical protein